MARIMFRKIERNRSLFSYGILFFISLISFLIGNYLSSQGYNVRAFSGSGLLLVIAGYAAIAFQRDAGFPELLHRSVKRKNRFYFPLIIGFAFALADLIAASLILSQSEYDSMLPFSKPLAYSILLYASEAIRIEVLYHAIPFTLLMFVVKKYFPAHTHNVSFWIFACVATLVERTASLPDTSMGFVVYGFISGSALNLIQAWNYKNYGFLASLFIRLGYYLIWHLLSWEVIWK